MIGERTMARAGDMLPGVVSMQAARERSLVGLSGASVERIRRLLTRACELRPAAMGEAEPMTILRGRTVATLFFESSTRTRTSFAIAAQRMGASVVDLSSGASSLSKGESMRDTARNIEAMGVHAIVTRAPQAGAAELIHDAVACSVINAGDGRHEHPTQGLLDMATLAEAFGRDREFDFRGLRVAIVGDVVSSRVARSAVAGLTKLGARVTLVGPPHLASKGLACLVEPSAGKPSLLSVEHDIDTVLPEMDAVMMLRIQFERHDGPGLGSAPSNEVKKAGPIASVRAYREHCGLTVERAKLMKPGAVVMHPGPINRGVEMDGPVADGLAGPRSLVLRQVSWGVAVRAAVLAECMGA
ncbi:MAG: aspartate carbamoyltransferase catalytic subunit [Phycisphaerales bacterium]|nr:aspartate carbamoyltransferase catalytic subunit [Phycisphaerales bacterium]